MEENQRLARGSHKVCLLVYRYQFGTLVCWQVFDMSCVYLKGLPTMQSKVCILRASWLLGRRTGKGSSHCLVQREMQVCCFCWTSFFTFFQNAWSSTFLSNALWHEFVKVWGLLKNVICSSKRRCSYFLRHGYCPFKLECIYWHDEARRQTARLVNVIYSFYLKVSFECVCF